MHTRIETALQVLICDPDPVSARELRAAIRATKLADWVMYSAEADTLEAAEALLLEGDVNTVFIDPNAYGVEAAARFIFSVRKTLPAVVFVLYLDPATVGHHGPDFDRDVPKRFGHYYKLWKPSGQALAVATVLQILRLCMSDYWKSVSALRLQRGCERLSGQWQPVEITESAARFREIYPADGPPIGFVMMRFGEGRAHARLWETVRKEFAALGLLAVRADEFAAHPELLSNVRTYLHCCDFGVVVIERIEHEHANSNVAFEVGYMTALGKPICLLRDQTVSVMPADLSGLLSNPFDVGDMRSLRLAIRRWVASQDFFGARSAAAARRAVEPVARVFTGVEAVS